MRTVPAAWVAVMVFGVGAISGCENLSGHPHSARSVLPTPQAGSQDVTLPGKTAEGCAIYDRGSDARLAIEGGETRQECASIGRDLSSGGSFWTSQYQSPQEPPLSAVCIMTSGPYTAEVDDDGGQAIGQQVCGGLLQAGWSEDNGAEQAHASAAAASASAAARSAAAASAAATQQEQEAEDQQNANTDLATLEQDANFSADLSAIAGDAKQTGTDLATTRTDASQGQGDLCDNASVTVNGDASVTIEGDADVSLSGDVNTLSTDIGNVRTDISNLQTDIHALGQDGLSGPRGADNAIAATRTAITTAITTANGDIHNVNADVVAAYAVANNLATGDCAGDGPGEPPMPIADIR